MKQGTLCMKTTLVRGIAAFFAVIAATLTAAPAAHARIIGTDLEVILGRDTAAALEQKYGLYRNKQEQERIERMGKQMVAVSGRTALNYHFGILDTGEINALAVPGGWVYTTRGLMEQHVTNDELAFVMGHEVAHIAHRDGVKQLEQGLGLSLAFGLIFNRSKTTQALVSDLLQLLLVRGYSRDDERDADLAAVDYARVTGYDPEGGVDFLQRLQKVGKSNPSALDRWFATHPPINERIATIEEKIRSAQKSRTH